ncbi:MAG: SphA family protein [Longimicrobiales bacterium]
MKLCRFVLTAALLSVVGVAPADGQFNGHNSLGDFGLLSGSQPDPGFYTAAFYYRYGADMVRDRNGDGLSLPLAMDPSEIAVDAFAPILWYVSDKKVLGANYGFMAVLPIATISLDVPVLGVGQDTGAGLGDIYLQPVNLGWHRDRADFTAGVGVFAPTGRYEVDAEDNTGLGMWSFELYGGATVFFDQEKTWHLATTAFWETHSSKKDSDAKVGDILSLEGGFGKSFLQGALSVGAAYYAQWKLTEDDFGLDFSLPGGSIIGKHKVLGLGPELTVPIATGDKLIALINARYLWELGARTKTEGYGLAITATFPIPSIPIT